MKIIKKYQTLLTTFITFSLGINSFICFAQTNERQWNALVHDGHEGLHSLVYTLFSDGDDLYVGGNFPYAGNVPQTGNIVRWDGAAWHALGNFAEVAEVNAIVKFRSDLYVGGVFHLEVDDTIARHLARWDGKAWHAVGDGGYLFNLPVIALAVFQDHLYIGGRFTDAAGIVNGDHLIRWDGEQFSSVGGGVSHSGGEEVLGVLTMEADEQNLYVGGNFLQAGNVPHTRNIARWDGTTWHALGEGFDGELGVMAIALKEQEVYAGGDGGPVGTPTCGVARWDGKLWHPMGDGLNACIDYKGAREIVVVGDSVFVGGKFSSAGGTDHTSCFAGWNGSEWFFLGEPQTEPYLLRGGYIETIVSHGNELFIGGVFTLNHVDGLIHNIGRWGESNTTSISILPNPKSITIEVFPSQTDGTFRYSFGHEATLHTMSVYNIWGRELIRKTQSEMQGDIQSLPSGLYILRIDMNGLSGVARLIKM